MANGRGCCAGKWGRKREVWRPQTTQKSEELVGKNMPEFSMLPSVTKGRG